MNKQLIKEAVREVLEDMGLGSTPIARKYYPTAEAWKVLGYENREQIYDAVKSGLFRLGIEVQDRRKPHGQMARWYFDIEKCQKRLNEKPERRR